MVSTESLPRTGPSCASVESLLSAESSIQSETEVEVPEEAKVVLKSGADRAWNRVRGFLGRRLL